MKRPNLTDELICQVAAEEWVEKNLDHLKREDYFYSEAGAKSFTKSLAEAARRGTIDAHALARHAKIETDDDTIEDLESFIAHHQSVFNRTVKQWKKGWAPKRPFEGEYGRVTFNICDDLAYTGIARIDNCLDEEGQLHLYLDKNKDDAKIMANPYGLFSSARIMNWEDVTDVHPLTDEDHRLIAEYQARVIQFEEESKANKAYNVAKQRMASDVKQHNSLNIAEANAIFSDLNVADKDIPLIISALTKVGIHKRLEGSDASKELLNRLI